MKEKNIINQLNLSLEQKKPLSVFTDPDDESLFIPGFVDKYDKNWLRIKILSNYGYFDGYGIRPLSSIVEIKSGTHYENSLEKLYNRNPSPFFDEFVIDDELNDSSILLSTIKCALKKNIPITFWDKKNYDEHVGFLVDADDSSMLFHKLLPYGLSAGEFKFYISDIYMLDIGGTMERSYMFLYQK